jgi:hypothetical protein
VAVFSERRCVQQVLHASDCSDLVSDCIDTEQVSL